MKYGVVDPSLPLNITKFYCESLQNRDTVRYFICLEQRKILEYHNSHTYFLIYLISKLEFKQSPSSIDKTTSHQQGVTAYNCAQTIVATNNTHTRTTWNMYSNYLQTHTHTHIHSEYQSSISFSVLCHLPFQQILRVYSLLSYFHLLCGTQNLCFTFSWELLIFHFSFSFFPFTFASSRLPSFFFLHLLFIYAIAYDAYNYKCIHRINNKFLCDVKQNISEKENSLCMFYAVIEHQ